VPVLPATGNRSRGNPANAEDGRPPGGHAGQPLADGGQGAAGHLGHPGDPGLDPPDHPPAGRVEHRPADMGPVTVPPLARAP
jgi:hypothetical protein